MRVRNVGVVASGLILLGCSGGSSSKGSSAQTGSTAAGASLKRLEVEVTPVGNAALPPSTFMAWLGALALGARTAEAAPAIPNCTVSASTLPGVTATTNGQGKAVLADVPVPATINVSCPDGTSGSFPINGEPGALVTIRVRGRAGRLEVRSRHGAISPSISEPSVSQSGHGSGSRRGSNSGSG